MRTYLQNSSKSFSSYLDTILAEPMLTPEEEAALGRRIKNDPEDRGAINALVTSHLKLVSSIARKYSGYGIPVEDLVQEGSVGLVIAAGKFDIDRGFRFATYAIPWIKSQILEYIQSNWRSWKIATTKPQKKLFFNLRTLKSQLQLDDENFQSSLTDSQVQEVAEKLNVKPEEVREMERRLAATEISLDAPIDEDADGRIFADRIADTYQEPSEVIQRYQQEYLLNYGTQQALEVLDERSRRVIMERWVETDDDGRGKTLVQLGQDLGISTERARQIEQAALKKMRKVLA